MAKTKKKCSKKQLMCWSKKGKGKRYVVCACKKTKAKKTKAKKTKAKKTKAKKNSAVKNVAIRLAAKKTKERMLKQFKKKAKIYRKARGSNLNGV